MKMSAPTQAQWVKVLKALYYSAGSGFTAGFMLALAGVLQNGNGNITQALTTAAIVGGVVGALNSLAVTVKQLFTAPEPAPTPASAAVVAPTTPDPATTPLGQ